MARSEFSKGLDAAVAPGYQFARVPSRRCLQGFSLGSSYRHLFLPRLEVQFTGCPESKPSHVLVQNTEREHPCCKQFLDTLILRWELAQTHRALP